MISKELEEIQNSTGVSPEVERILAIPQHQIYNYFFVASREDRLPPRVLTALKVPSEVEEILKDVKPRVLEAAKKARYVPVSEPFSDTLDYVVDYARYVGRIRISSSLWREISSQFGGEEGLHGNFMRLFGFIDDEEGKRITEILRGATGVRALSWTDCKRTLSELTFRTEQKLFGEKGILVLGKLVVLDDMGRKGGIRVYEWPFMGFRNPTEFQPPPPQLEPDIKQALERGGLNPWRVGTIDIAPGSRTPRTTVCVFVGK